MNGYKKIIEKYDITDNLKHIVSISTDEEKLFLNVEYDGRYTVEKMFKNNSLGLMDLQMTREKLNNEEKVLKYFGLGD